MSHCTTDIQRSQRLTLSQLVSARLKHIIIENSPNLIKIYFNSTTKRVVLSFSATYNQLTCGLSSSFKHYPLTDYYRVLQSPIGNGVHGSIGHPMESFGVPERNQSNIFSNLTIFGLIEMFYKATYNKVRMVHCIDSGARL